MNMSHGVMSTPSFDDVSVHALRDVHTRSPKRYSVAVERSRAVERYVHNVRDGSPVLQRQRQQQAELVSEAESLVRQKLSALQLPRRTIHGASGTSPSRLRTHYIPGQRSPTRSLQPLTPMCNTHHIHHDSSLLRGWW